MVCTLWHNKLPTQCVSHSAIVKYFILNPLPAPKHTISLQRNLSSTSNFTASSLQLKILEEVITLWFQVLSFWGNFTSPCFSAGHSMDISWKFFIVAFLALYSASHPFTLIRRILKANKDTCSELFMFNNFW